MKALVSLVLAVAAMLSVSACVIDHDGYAHRDNDRGAYGFNHGAYGDHQGAFGHDYDHDGYR